MQVEVYLPDGSICRTYEIDSDCARILVFTDPDEPRVYGFMDTGDPNCPRQVEGVLIREELNPVFTA